MTETLQPAGNTTINRAVVDAAQLVRLGKTYSLAAARFPGMPLFPGHPPFQVISYRTPHGLHCAGDNLWSPVPNEAHLGCMTEVVSGTTHSGAHVDALAHITIGPDDHWFGGANADEHLGDFGPMVGDATELPPVFTRGVLLDVAGHRGVSCLDAGEPISAQELKAVAEAQGTEVRPGNVVLVRTGYMGLWPDGAMMALHKTPGPDLSAAEWLIERRVIATGSDTETFEVQPTRDAGTPSNPQPVHVRLLIDEGIYIMECLDLEVIAAAQVHEFLFVALPLKIRGATGSMIDPLAVI
ncbi:MAG TPA: cyclase family protein [Acidimicrobiales bacterium]|nr:cyclase family protein [Acidimicrobiales bacterium]